MENQESGTHQQVVSITNNIGDIVKDFRDQIHIHLSLLAPAEQDRFQRVFQSLLESVPADKQEDMLQTQISLLEDMKAAIEANHTEISTEFVSIKDRDERASKQGVWLTVISSIISLTLGWLLSLLGTPSTVLHLFGH
jgi:transcriptional regulator of heat shock response